MLLLVLYRSRNPFFASALTARSSLASTEGENSDLGNDVGQSNKVRGRIEGAYRDEPLTESKRDGEEHLASSQPNERHDDGPNGRGLVMQPRGLQNEGNEWREA